MAIQVIDRRSSQNFVAQVSNLKSAKEVSMVKAQVIVAKSQAQVVNPSKEVVVKQEERKYTWSEVKVMVQKAYNRGLSEKEVVPTKHQEVKKQVIRIAAQTEKPVQEVKAHADMHEAGRKAYLTRILKQQEVTLKQVAKEYAPGVVFEVEQDKGTPMAKTLKMKFDKVVGKVAFFRVKITKKGHQDRYEQFSIQF